MFSNRTPKFNTAKSKNCTLWIRLNSTPPPPPSSKRLPQYAFLVSEIRVPYISCLQASQSTVNIFQIVTFTL